MFLKIKKLILEETKLTYGLVDYKSELIKEYNIRPRFFFLIKKFRLFVYPTTRIITTKKLATKWVYSELYSQPELIKHWTKRQLGRYLAKKLSRKSSILLIKLNLLFIKKIYEAFRAYKKYLSTSSPMMPSIAIFNTSPLSKLGRTIKKKRSIRRSYRARLFFSKKGRIWLT